jgi:metallo-beta-lactamase family protein
LASERAPTLRFLGGTGTVTGSRFLLTAGGSRVLLDCGLFQGEKALRLRNWEPFPIEPARLDAVVLTHAHLDHSGYLPALVRGGFRGSVHATRGTAALCEILLPDSGRLQEEDADYANRKGYSKHEPALPLYREADARAALARLRPEPFGRAVDVAPGVQLRFRPAGHILGAASLELRIDGPRPRDLLLSGDLGRPEHPFLVAPAAAPAADAVLVESTYGDRRHTPADDLDAALAGAISRTAERGGVALIPAFAVDRTEVVLHHLARLTAEGRMPDLPVYVDSPMALAALAAYRRALQEGWEEVRPELRGRTPSFERLSLREVQSVAESKEVQALAGPFVVVSASGMATGGRVLHHLRARLPDPKSSVLLVGFQVPGTRGWRLQRGEPALKMFGRYVPVAAEIVDLAGFSVHADGDELLAWLGSAPRPPDVTFVVHGEPAASQALLHRITGELRRAAAVPRHLERVRL